MKRILFVASIFFANLGIARASDPTDEEIKQYWHGQVTTVGLSCFQGAQATAIHFEIPLPVLLGSPTLTPDECLGLW